MIIMVPGDADSAAIPTPPSSVRGGIFVFAASAAVDTLRVFQFKTCRVSIREAPKKNRQVPQHWWGMLTKSNGYSLL